MIPVEVLEEALRSRFHYSVTATARQLYSNKAVISVSIDTDQIFARVLHKGKIYDVDFDYFDSKYLRNDDDELLQGDCDCGVENCVHQAAALMASIEKKKVGSAKFFKNKPPVAKPIIDLSRELKGRHAGEYRPFPIERGWKRALNQFSQANPSLYNRWNESFEGKFITPNELELQNVYTNYYVARKGDKKIRIKVEQDGKVYIKCMSCETRTSKLCSHQTEILQKASPVLENLNLKDPNCYENVLRNAAKTLGVPAQAITTYFDL
ncbi:MAG: hypothetical protein AAGI49_18875, partial [Bacteroidota bacterium]